MLLLVQPRIWVAFWAVSAHYWLIPSCSSTGNPKAFLTGLFVVFWTPSHLSGMLTTTLSLVSSANLLRVHSILLFLSVMTILNSTGRNMEP